MAGTEESSNKSSRYGLRFEDMSAEELEHYRQFWQEPAPVEGEPGYMLPVAQAVRARIRMSYGLSFTLFAVGVLLSLIPLLSFNLLLASLGALVALAGVGMLIAVRRRLFTSLRIPGQAPVAKNKKARWFLFPHALLLSGTATALVAIAVIPQIFAEAEPALVRSHAALWGELTLMFWLLSALFYGLIALAVYTPEDTDDSVIRPTDFAERQLEKDLARGRHRDDEDFYDSGWITGR